MEGRERENKAERNNALASNGVINNGANYIRTSEMDLISQMEKNNNAWDGAKYRSEAASVKADAAENNENLAASPA